MLDGEEVGEDIVVVVEDVPAAEIGEAEVELAFNSTSQRAACSVGGEGRGRPEQNHSVDPILHASWYQAC